jgi:hypothetical protein
MGIRRFLRSVFWTGPRCSQCGQPLEPVQRGDIMPTRTRHPCTTMRCLRCGGLICEYCQGFGFGMIGGCKNCGGTQFEAFEMWMYVD